MFNQAVDATNTHAQGSGLTVAEQTAIVNFEMALSTAQAYDYQAGALDGNGGLGGPTTLANVTMPSFFVGINDHLGGNPKGTPFTAVIFGLYDAWTNLPILRGLASRAPYFHNGSASS